MGAPPRLFTFTARNPVTKETITFLGQGASLIEAIGDAGKTLQLSFRHRDGVSREPQNVNVTLADGTKALRTLSAFEADTPFEQA